MQRSHLLFRLAGGTVCRTGVVQLSAWKDFAMALPRKSAVLAAIDVTIRRIADNENISAEERLKLINELLDLRIGMIGEPSVLGEKETR